MRYIGIDPGSYTAISILEDKMVVGTMSINLNKVKTNKILFYYNALHKIITFNHPEIIYCEEPFMPPKFPQAGKSMNKKLALIELVCQQLDVKYAFINPSVVKKTITGNGKAEKDKLALGLKSILDNPGVIDDLMSINKFDETDSIAIAITGYRTGGL